MFNPSKIIQRSPDNNEEAGGNDLNQKGVKKIVSSEGIVCPNEEIKLLWPKIYEKIKSEISVHSDYEIPFEKRIREILKEVLGAELIRTNDEYKQFFKDALRFAINLDTDKILHKIEGGRSRYGEARHAKGKIQPDLELRSNEAE